MHQREREREMCNKNSPAPDEGAAKRRSDRIRSKRKRKQAEVSPLKPARRARTKTRKPKYLSLKLELASQEETQKMNQEEEKQQLNLFPLHPENLVEDKDRDYCSHYDTVAAYLFNSTPESTISTIHDLLDTTTTTTTSEECPLSPSLTYGYRDHLVRTAMRSKEREASQEERWVCYSEVVEEKKEQEEVMSSSCGDGAGAANGDAHGDPAVKGKRLALALKLDYQQILNAWSDKGPLYIDGESPLTVPDLHAGGADVVMHGTWAVPEVAGCVGGGFQRSGEWNAKEKLKKGQREASVLRYKEKRQSRLFSKRIRYEVRKLNAEKRPRMKGRFVKIS